ncbi:hypothetical protein Y032_0668g1347 [Ancylostoma ceylanicum]|uniref:Helix-turn-helix domain-containing protein n=1 Tax=Ancylostoma ceylanicum TaxID=53326 RepID=A0A016WHY3_9BILA|nr:hypothetical protein Y032_0668g1347 [Ancylostoma ceylanicum]
MWAEPGQDYRVSAPCTVLLKKIDRLRDCTIAARSEREMRREHAPSVTLNDDTVSRNIPNHGISRRLFDLHNRSIELSWKTDIHWYRKPSSNNIILHSRSAHPTYMKVNVERNLVKTSERIATSNSEIDESIQRILFENGYNSGETTTWRPYAAADGIALVLPYLNDHHAKRVNAIVKRSQLPVRLIFQPPPTLKEMLTSPRLYENGCDEKGCRYCTDKKICHLRGTVCLIKCGRCGHRYIGETGRPLRKRLDEHRRALASPQAYPNNSFSRHRTAVHTRDSPPEFEVVVLYRHLENPLHRKIMEAREIKRFQPEINNKEELVEALKLIS